MSKRSPAGKRFLKNVKIKMIKIKNMHFTTVDLTRIFGFESENANINNQAGKPKYILKIKRWCTFCFNNPKTPKVNSIA